VQIVIFCLAMSGILLTAVTKKSFYSDPKYLGACASG